MAQVLNVIERDGRGIMINSDINFNKISNKDQNFVDYNDKNMWTQRYKDEKQQQRQPSSRNYSLSQQKSQKSNLHPEAYQIKQNNVKWRNQNINTELKTSA